MISPLNKKPNHTSPEPQISPLQKTTLLSFDNLANSKNVHLNLDGADQLDEEHLVCCQPNFLHLVHLLRERAGREIPLGQHLFSDMAERQTLPKRCLNAKVRLRTRLR